MSHALLIEAGASATWLETFDAHDAHVAHDAGADGAPREVRIRLADHSRLTHYRLLGHGAPADVDDKLTVEVGAGATYEQRVLAAPSGRLHSQQLIRLVGRGATATLGAACVARPRAQVDLDITVVHEADDTASDQRINLLGAEHGKASAQVETQVPPGRHGVRANQLLRALQPAGRTVVSLRPRLSILSDDVVARHGATTSAIREDELHYLRSRGIARDDAVAMLSEAFLRQMLPSGDTGEVGSLIERVLAGALQRDAELMA